jgi:glycosyltransferase involved in cell wall biosynthesis
MNSLVSVIIPNFNYASYLPDAITSVLNQTYRNIEIIVVNNGSTDHSMEVLQKFEGLIRIIDQDNLGQSGARNSGIEAAKGDYLAFLDADDVWAPSKLESQLAKITYGTELVYSGLKRFQNDSGKVISEELPLHAGDCSSIFLEKPGIAVVLGGESTVLITRKLVEKVGFFDRNLNSAAGWDFFRRCSQHTFFEYVPEFLVNYRIHGKNLSNSPESNISDIRRSFFKLVGESSSYDSGWLAMKTYLSLEWGFLKTLIVHKKFRQAFVLSIAFPARGLNLLHRYSAKTL